MANKNSNLHAAKAAKNDEFYTRFEDIEAELKHYKQHFAGKVVYCNCDDPKDSAFSRFFRKKFVDYGLKKLITTSYDENGHGKVYIADCDTNNNGQIDDNEIVVNELEGNGDFASPECVALLQEADIVVTNPPFSLFREYMALLMQYNKQFLIIGSMNAITYKEIFPLIKNNKVWLGMHSVKEFIMPDGNTKKFGNIMWYTNLNHSRRNEEIICFQSYKKHPELFPKYDNYDAIEVSKTKDIPEDYDGVMGVPISFLDKYNPNQFEIVGFRKGDDGKDLVYTRERERVQPYFRVLIQRK